jgi:hypothetical protein
MCYKNVLKKHDYQSMDLFGFFEAIEILSQKIYKDESNPDKPHFE